MAFSQAALAKHLGVSQRAVAKAISDGRLVRSIVTEGGHAKITDIAAAAREWESTTQARVDHDEDEDPSYPIYRARREAANARKAELELAEMEKTLVSRADVEAQGSAFRVAIKSKFLTATELYRHVCPELSEDQIEKLEDVNRQLLEELAQEEEELGDSDGA